MEDKELLKLFKKTSFAKENAKWEGLEINKEGYIYVPQGSHLGETLIVFDDDYEGSGEDALFIQELIKRYKEKWRKITKD